MFQNFYEVKITGKDVNRFIKKLYQNKIYIEQIEFSNKVVYLKLSKDDYDKLKKIKTIYEIKVIRLYGPIKVIDLLKRYSIFLIISLIGMIYLIFLSNVIFEVDVIHSKKEIRNLLYSELKKYNISKFSFVKSFSTKEKIESIILEKYKDKLEWLEINRVGTKYYIRVEERIIKKPKESINPRNIIAKKDGIIMKIEASRGEVVKKVNDYVKKGDVIISGAITKGEDIKNKVAAVGEVYAEVWYKTTVNMPFYYKEERKTGKNKISLKLNLLNKDILKLFKLKRYKASKESNIFVLGNKLLPVQLKLVKEYEVILNEKLYSYDDAVTEAKKRSYNKIKSKLGKNERVLKQKVIEVSENENYVQVIIFYKIYENITSYGDILENTTDKNIE